MRKANPINGLILYSLYSASGNIAILLSMSLLVGFILLFTGENALFLPMIGSGLAALSSGIMISAHKDSASKWTKFQLALPVKRSDVIASKYLGHLLMLAAGIVMTVIFAGLSIVLHENLLEFGLKNAPIVITLCIGTSLISCALFYPITYTIGSDKDEAISIICLLGAGGISFLIAWIGGMLFGKENIAPMVFCIVISLILFGISYILTKNIYTKKDI